MDSARVVVIGAGIIGLSTAMMLERDGHEVVVLDQSDVAMPDSPEQAWASWTRPGVNQFHQPHQLLPGGCRVLQERLPDVLDELSGLGAEPFNILSLLPGQIADRAARPGDDRYDTLSARRPVLEYAVAACARRTVEIRRGVHVTGLLAEPGAVPQVKGVRTVAGDLAADLVIDASGRNSRMPAWLAGVGAQAPLVEAAAARTAYYSRFFHGPKLPKFPEGGLGQAFDSYSIITLPGDRGSWSVVVISSSIDQELKELRHVDKWMELVSACADLAPTLAGEVEDGINIMGGNGERLNRFVVDGLPIATGVLAVGDALATTNPSYGRGMSIGLLAAAGTADVVREQHVDPFKLALAHDTMLVERVHPWFHETVQISTAREAQIEAVLNGCPQQAPESGTDPVHDLILAGFHDADLFRAWASNMSALSTLAEQLARPGLIERATAIARQQKRPVPPGPSRAELRKLLA